MSKHRRGAGPGQSEEEGVVGLRIIGGTLRGRKLDYSGDTRTRPMKDRVREAVFNLLGPGVRGSHAIDLFAGTGALGLEAISRGAAQATFLERHYPTIRLIEQNAAALGVREQANVVFGDAFLWSKKFAPNSGERLTVFCSPPYDLYVERLGDMVELIGHWLSMSPEGSLMVVEADERFDFSALAQWGEWDTRQYLPACVGVLGK